jgi:microcin C transport system substrate-binding protein
MRQHILGLAASLMLSLGAGATQAADRHGLSAVGELKDPAGFTHFGYVNPDAPKGGRLSMMGVGSTLTFDSFNPFILNGDQAQGLELLFDSLMVRAADEPDSMYGLVASGAEVAADGLSVTFTLRPEAKWADGTALTADDVCFSFDTLKTKGDWASYRAPLTDVTRCDIAGEGRVRYTFQGKQLRDLPLTVAGLPIISKTYYTTKEDFEKTTLKPPLGSGPYEIGDFRQGTFVTYRRRAAYWAKDLPVNRGRYNFDEIRYEYFRDRTAGLEAFKAGSYDLREEFTSRDWATAYDIPQVRDGRILKLTLPDENPSGTQGFFLNLRRGKFQDERVRQALGFAFDFEFMNKNLFYGLYTRTQSYFENSPMKAQGAPGDDELKLLSAYKDKLPAGVFGPVYVPPVTDGSGTDRRLLSQAAKLLDEAGWASQGGKRVKNGETLGIEFLIDEPSFERVLGPYINNLKAIGIDANIRRVDAAQYERRVKSFDFDIITTRFVMRLTPGVELKAYFGSQAAKQDGSRNLAGIADPAIDALVDTALEAHGRSELDTAVKALDRVLRAGHYWVPHWYKAAHNIAVWNKFSWPDQKPKYDRGIDTWWFDAAKAAKVRSN